MLWIKAFHLFFVIAWFVSLFYLPRLMVYHVNTADGAGHDRFCLMERRLYLMGLIGMIGTWALGMALLMHNPAFMKMGWMHAKLGMVVLLSAYYGWLKTRMRAFAQGRNTRSAKFYRIANEIPSVALLIVLVLVVVKPF